MASSNSAWSSDGRGQYTRVNEDWNPFDPLVTAHQPVHASPGPFDDLYDDNMLHYAPPSAPPIQYLTSPPPTEPGYSQPGPSGAAQWRTDGLTEGATEGATYSCCFTFPSSAVCD